jgi:secondary thiamine-phosphate synthase enzyme
MHVRALGLHAGWPGGHAAWVAQEPINAHSHLISIALGNSQTVPVHKGTLTLGTWQSVLLVECDGPRPRTVGLQLVGMQG